MTKHERPAVLKAISMRQLGFSFRDIEFETGVHRTLVKTRLEPEYKKLLVEYAIASDWKHKCMTGNGDPNVHYKIIRTFPFKSLSPELSVIALPKLKCLERKAI